VTGSKAEKDLYDQCHLAWRAGLIESWYFGPRTLAISNTAGIHDENRGGEWNGVETDPGELSALLEETKRRERVVSIGWGSTWCGYRAVCVTYADGRQITERFDGVSVVLVETEREVAA
jgi:hypothetical protein